MKAKAPESIAGVPRRGVARVISKLGVASRTEAARWVGAGRVGVNVKVVRDPEFPVIQGRDRISIDGIEQTVPERVVVMLNKPRGLVTTAHDERVRDTVYVGFEGSSLPWLAPVGRLDKASEGILLFGNDPVWAARISSPIYGPVKKYHVHDDYLPDAALLAGLERGVVLEGERLAIKSATLPRRGERNACLEIILDEGGNRQIRRLLAAVDITVLRLIRVAIGSLSLGELQRAGWQIVTQHEMDSL